MSTYVIGDIHGSMRTLEALLDAIAYDRASDELWLVGDLVNNGPRSAEVVRWAMDQGDRLVCVLGNHDLHMLAVAAGVRPARRKDTFSDLLDAPDAAAMLDWLRRRPMLHRRGDDVMIHAGLAPGWSSEDATACARELEEALRDEAGLVTFFEQMYGNEPRRFGPELERADRLRLTVNALTRMRAVNADDGALDFDFKGQLDQMPQGLVPWFERCEAFPTARIFFGHWSAIGYHRAGRVHALDSGATWGRALTAYRLEDDRRFQVPTAPDEAAGA